MAIIPIKGVQLPTGIKGVRKMVNPDSYYGNYSSMRDALDTIKLSLREQSRTFCVITDGISKEYWWNTSDLSDEGVVEKNQSSGNNQQGKIEIISSDGTIEIVENEGNYDIKVKEKIREEFILSLGSILEDELFVDLETINLVEQVFFDGMLMYENSYIHEEENERIVLNELPSLYNENENGHVITIIGKNIISI